MKYIVIILPLVAIALLVVVTGLAQDEEPFPPDQLPEYIWSIAWSPMGDVIAIGIGAERCFYENNDYSIRIMDAQTGLVNSNIGLDNVCPATDLGWNPVGTNLFSSGIGEPIVVWDVATGYSVAGLAPATLPGFINNQWSPDGNRIASVQEANSQITIWNPANGNVTLNIEAGFPSGVTWKPDGTNLAASGTATNLTTIYDSSNGQVVNSFAGTFTSIAWSPDGTQIAAADSANNILLLNPTNGSVLRTLSGHTGTVGRLVWRFDSHYLASAGYDDTVRVWDTNAGTQLDVFTSTSALPAVDWSPDGTELAYAGEGNMVEIVSAPSGVGTTPTATTTLTPTATPPASGTGTGLRGEYFDDTTFTALKLTRVERVGVLLPSFRTMSRQHTFTGCRWLAQAIQTPRWRG